MEQFPNFTPLTWDMRDALVTLSKNYLPYSSFYPTSMLAYAGDSQMAVARDNGNLVCRFRNQVTGAVCYSLLGEGEGSAVTLRKILGLDGQPALASEVQWVNEEAVASLGTEEFDVRGDPDHDDYVLDVQDMVALSGRRFRRIRNSIAVFYRRYPQCRIELINVADAAIKAEVIDLFDSATIAREDSLPAKQPMVWGDERPALLLMLAVAEQFDLVSVGVWDRDRLVGYVIAEKGHGNYMMVHFWRAIRSYPAATVTMLRFLAKHAAEIGCSSFNVQDDAGRSGLRRYKRSLRPIKYLRCYTVQPLTMNQGLARLSIKE